MFDNVQPNEKRYIESCFVFEKNKGDAMSFSFQCQYCSKEVEAAEEWIGQIAECPSCGKKITIPNPKESSGPHINLRSEIPCPFCRELILEGAKKCKHCGSSLDENHGVAKFAGKKHFVLGIGLLLVIGCGIAGSMWYLRVQQSQEVKPTKEMNSLISIEPSKEDMNRFISIAQRDAVEKGITFSANFTILELCPETFVGVYEIPECVTTIGKGAFQYCGNLANVTIPNSVTSIELAAFSFCKSLTSVTIPNSVTSIGDAAFLDCQSLTSVTIPNSVTSIGIGVFTWCKSLNSVTIPNSVTSIGDAAFKSCSELISVTIPTSVTTIGNGAFCDCGSLTSVSIPNSVTTVGKGAFSSCKRLTSVTIPNSVTSIGEYAFLGCPCEDWVKNNYGHLYK